MRELNHVEKEKIEFKHPANTVSIALSSMSVSQRRVRGKTISKVFCYFLFPRNQNSEKFLAIRRKVSMNKTYNYFFRGRLVKFFGVFEKRKNLEKKVQKKTFEKERLLVRWGKVEFSRK